MGNFPRVYFKMFTFHPLPAGSKTRFFSGPHNDNLKGLLTVKLMKMWGHP